MMSRGHFCSMLDEYRTVTCITLFHNQMSFAPDRFDPAEFNARVLEWAKRTFLDEVHSGFLRSKTFDADRTVEQLTALRKQPLEHLRILAQVLPLRLISETPDAVERRKQLTPEQAQAVEQLRADYDAEWRKHWARSIDRLASANRIEVQREFKTAAKKGKLELKQIASVWNCEAVTAGPGEWGLICRRKWGRFTVSLNLGRAMTLGYTLSVLANDLHSIRYQDHYLGVLGVGAGEWNVQSAEDLPVKFEKATSFAKWHLEEYEAIIEQLA